jgi:hypothetical protein
LSARRSSSSKEKAELKIGVRIAGGVLIIAGVVWFLQGINILPGSFMTGQIEWAVYGALAALAGVGLIVWGRRGGKSKS